MNGEVYEIIVDGQSGAVPAGQGFPLVFGTCSKGTVGAPVIVGKDTDIDDKFGVGSLPEKLKDLLAYSGQDAGVIAVRVAADVAGSIGSITKTGTGTSTGTTSGTPTMSAEVKISIESDGDLNVATFKYSIDGGDTWSKVVTMPLAGVVAIGSSGVSVTFIGGTNAFKKGDIHFFNIVGPKASLTNVLTVMNPLLETFDVEFIYITEPTASSDWAALGIKAQELWDAHKPTFFLLTTRTKNDIETIDEYITYHTTQKTGFSHRFIAVCAGYGDIIDSSAKRKIRDFSGIIAGLIIQAKVNQSIAEVASFPITTVNFPDGWKNSHSTYLESLGYITLKTYSGINNKFVVEARTLAEDTSDYKFLESLRTMFKATRLARKKALTYLKKGVANGKVGLAAVESGIEEAVRNGMKKVIPAELDDVDVVIPDGQDINNNGLAFELTVYGIPIIRKITMYLKLKNAAT